MPGSGLKSAWSAAGALDERPARPVARMTLVNAMVQAAVLPLVIVAFAAGLLLRQGGLTAAALLALALAAATRALLEALRIRLALSRGYWPGWGGGPIPRAGQPRRFWTRTGFYGVLAAVQTAAAGALAFLALLWMTNRFF